MLAYRIIPTMLCKGRSLVKGTRFVNDRVVGHVLQAARTHAKRGVDELLILDITATAEGRGPDLKMIEELTEDIHVPVTVGGGIKNLGQIKDLLRAGADKVSIGSGATPGFLYSAWDKFGGQAIVASLDYSPRQTYEDAIGQARRFSLSGAGEVLLNNKARDGTMEGYDLELIRQVAEAIPVPLIACGGCRDYDDMVSAIQAGASAVAVGALFQFEEATPLEAAKYLKLKGLEARIP